MHNITTLEELDQLEKPVVVKAWAEWCQPCKRFAPHFEGAEKQLDGFTFAAFDSDASPELVEHFEVQSIPFVALVTDQVTPLKSRTLVQLVNEVKGM